MNLQEYCKEIAKEHNERAKTASHVRDLEILLKRGKEEIACYDSYLLHSCERFIDKSIWIHAGLNLAIEFELTHSATLDWLLECEKVKRPYFEICGPRIKKETAEKLVKIYNLQTASKEDPARVCTLCSFGNQGAQTTNYSLFHLDGRVGLNGTFDRLDDQCTPATLHCSLLLFLLELIALEPKLEFAMMITKWDEVPDRFQNMEDAQLPCTWEFAPRPEDVSYGVAYDPKTRCIRILKPESAWNAVKKYQAQYTEEERRVFDPVQSREYYEKDPEGCRQLIAFLNRPLQKCISGEILFQSYIENMEAEYHNPNVPIMPFSLKAWKALYPDLELKILCEHPLMLTRSWLLCFDHNDRRPVVGEHLYFEICGPRITKQEAMRMAADYNEPSARNMIGEMCCYDRTGGSGIFHLDGSVGGSGIPLRTNDMDKIMESVLDTVSTYPDFEFMLLIFRAGPKITWENGMAVYEQRAVECGIQYDPIKKLLTVLNPRSAYCRMRKYQEQYTIEERRLFEKEACRQYYTRNPKGKEERVKFAEYQQNVFHKKM